MLVCVWVCLLCFCLWVYEETGESNPDLKSSSWAQCVCNHWCCFTMEVPHLLMKTLSPLLAACLLALRLEKTWQITDRNYVSISSKKTWFYSIRWDLQAPNLSKSAFQRMFFSGILSSHWNHCSYQEAPQHQCIAMLLLPNIHISWSMLRK